MSTEQQLYIPNSDVQVLWVKRIYLELYRAHQKTLELRLGYPSFRLIGVGTTLRLNNQPDCERLVIRIGEYATAGELAESEDLSRIDPTISSLDLLRELRKRSRLISEFHLLAFDLA
jgi:ASC-1-like (ASCH) protein